jgi:2OG-Fe(II) oxygenase superfamily
VKSFHHQKFTLILVSLLMNERHPVVADLLSPDFLNSVEELTRSFRLNKPCAHVSVENLLEAQFCRRLLDEFPQCDRDVLQRFHMNGMRSGKSKYQNIRELGEAFKNLDELVKSKFFTDLLSGITGIPNLIYDPDYYGGGTHESLNGERLLPHIDYNYHPKNWYRRLNLLIYLNPEWDDGWGGMLELHSNPLNPDLDEVVKNPIRLNNCTILETSSVSWHGFPSIELPVDKRDISRRSIAVYYYTEHPPVEDTKLNRSTIYIDEPLPSYFVSGRTLTNEDLVVLRELLQVRGWHSKELLNEVINRGFDFVNWLKPGYKLNPNDEHRLHNILQNIDLISDTLEKMHLVLRNPGQESAAINASWLREKENMSFSKKYSLTILAFRSLLSRVSRVFSNRL